MKSVKQIQVLTYCAIAVVLLLQGIWIINAYQLIEKQVYSQIDEAFKVSVNKELMLRKNTVTDSTTYEIVGVVSDDFEKGIFSGPELVYQEFLIKKNRKIVINTVDSIFHSEIARHKLHGTFIINRLNPATGEVLETTDPKGTGVLKGALASAIVPIRTDGSEGVQALLISPYRAVFRQMLLALVLSLLLIFFVAYALFFVTRSFTKERRLRRLQTDFSHALTHNMASPLHVIANVISMLGNEQINNDPEKRTGFVHLAQQQVLNLQALTNRILTLANAEESKLDIQPETLNVNDMVSSLIENFTAQATKKVHFDTRFSPGEITMQADITLFRDAIGNLIDNAVKYSGENVNIAIRAEQDETGTFIYIKDNGYGISPKDQQKIFAKFERGKAVKRNEARGFGLGLSYVKEVVYAHGGSISLHSDEGKGSEFVLFLPVSVKENIHKTGKDDKDSLG